MWYIPIATHLNSLILREGISKSIRSRLNIRKCVATLRGTFFGVFLFGNTLF